MGFFGLKNYGDSDEAWDFWYLIQKAKGNKPKIKKLIAKELRNHTNQFNTDGFINLALYLETEGAKIDTAFSHNDDTTFVISPFITQTQYKTIIAKLRATIADKGWNGRMKTALRRMLKSVESKRRKQKGKK